MGGYKWEQEGEGPGFIACPHQECVPGFFMCLIPPKPTDIMTHHVQAGFARNTQPLE